jgi:hypothetical protein
MSHTSLTLTHTRSRSILFSPEKEISILCISCEKMKLYENENEHVVEHTHTLTHTDANVILNRKNTQIPAQS